YLLPCSCTGVWLARLGKEWRKCRNSSIQLPFGRHSDCPCGKGRSGAGKYGRCILATPVGLLPVSCSVNRLAERSKERWHQRNRWTVQTNGVCKASSDRSGIQREY